MKIYRPTPIFIFKESKYDNELRSPLLESNLDYKRPLPEPDSHSGSVSCEDLSGSEGGQSFKTMD